MKTTSIGKCMNAVWIDHAGRSTMPSPRGSARRPSSPRMRRSVLSATVTDRRRSGRPRGAASACLAVASVQLPERLRDRDERREEQHDEHRREDEEDRAGTASSPAPSGPAPRRLALRFLRISSARLRRIWLIETPSVSPWMMPRTNALMPGRVDAVGEVVERLGRGEAHALLLEREPELLRQAGRRAPAAASRSEPLKPIPASTVTTSRSISSGSSLSIAWWRSCGLAVEDDRGQVPAEERGDDDAQRRTRRVDMPVATPSSRNRNVNAQRARAADSP